MASKKRPRSKTPAGTTLTGEPRIIGPGFRARVYALVKRVPRGKVTTYGDVAGALGSRRVARQVGFALAALAEREDVPWQRVINALGRISFKGDLVRANEQRALLEAEGLEFDVTGRVVDFEDRKHAFAPPRGTPRVKAKRTKRAR